MRLQVLSQYVPRRVLLHQLLMLRTVPQVIAIGKKNLQACLHPFQSQLQHQ